MCKGLTKKLFPRVKIFHCIKSKLLKEKNYVKYSLAPLQPNHQFIRGDFICGWGDAFQGQKDKGCKFSLSERAACFQQNRYQKEYCSRAAQQNNFQAHPNGSDIFLLANKTRLRAVKLKSERNKHGSCELAAFMALSQETVLTGCSKSCLVVMEKNYKIQ